MVLGKLWRIVPRAQPVADRTQEKIMMDVKGKIFWLAVFAWITAIGFVTWSMIDRLLSMQRDDMTYVNIFIVVGAGLYAAVMGPSKASQWIDGRKQAS
jgi:hypothetical protein